MGQRDYERDYADAFAWAMFRLVVQQGVSMAEAYTRAKVEADTLVPHPGLLRGVTA